MRLTFSCLVGVSACGLWLAGVAIAGADSIVIPGYLADVEGNDLDTAPLGNDIQRFQTVMGPSLLSELNVGDQISGITFRLNRRQTPVPPQAVANYEIRLGQSLNNPGSLSLTFAENRGPDMILVRSGPWQINTGDFPGGGTPRPFGVIIPFTTPYTYQGGPLLLELAHDGFPIGGRNADAQSDVEDAESIFGTGFDATFAGIGSFPYMIVTQFAVNPVPEPATWGTLALVGFLGLAHRRRIAPHALSPGLNKPPS